MNAFDQVCELVQTQAAYSGYNETALSEGVIPFATISQVQYIAMLTRASGVPEGWRKYIISAIAGRELRSTKDLSMIEASAIIEWFLHGSEGAEDCDTGPCAEALTVMGEALVEVLKAGHAEIQRQEAESPVVYAQLGLC